MKKRGIGLLTVIGVASVLAIMIGVVSSQAVEHTRVVANQDWRDRAYYAAYAGIQYCCGQLEADPYRDTVPQPDQAFANDPSTRFSVTISNNLAGTSSANGSLDAPDGTVVPAGRIYIRSDGNCSARGDGCMTMRAMVALARPQFSDALFADEDMVLDAGTVLDSYNTATYGGPGRNAATVATNADNANDGAPLTINTAAVNTTVKVGVTAPSDTSSLLSTTLTNNPFTVTRLSSAKKKPAFAVPNGAPSVPNSDTSVAASAISNSGTVRSFRNLNITGTSTIQAGTYYVANNLTIDTAQLSVTPSGSGSDKVYLYVGKGVNISSSTINANGKPNQIQVFVIGGETDPTNNIGSNASENTNRQGFLNVTSSSNVTMVSAGWGLNATIEGASHLAGAVIGSHIKLTGSSQVHYDESLRTQMLGQVQDTAFTGYIFNLGSTTNPALRNKIFAGSLGTFEQVTVPVGQLGTVE